MINSDRLPPENIEAEAAILGGILLDPRAMEEVVDILTPDTFYVSAHGEIYRAALTLFREGKPTDLMMVTSYLADHEKLEGVGGTSRLATLVHRTVSAINIDRYAALVVDKYLRRQLIKEANEIAASAYDNSRDFEEVIDEAEQRIFTVAQHRPTQEVEPVGDILIRNFNEIEQYANGVVQPGLNTGLTEIDRITGGLQRQDLIIVGGRPSTGKTALSTNLAYNIALLHNLPVIIFSLEMSKEQLTYRLLSPLARIEYERLKAGRISLGELTPLTLAIGQLSELPIFIDDTSNPPVLEIRAKVRRIAAQHGQLGLVLIDYLQLMSGSDSSNRVQELDRISRELKQLAKDFNVPVMCLSQLHRGVEGRQDKHPMMSDLRDCLAGDALVTNAETGVRVSVREIVEKGLRFNVWAINSEWKLVSRPIVDAWAVGTQTVYKVTTRTGRTLRCSGGHRLMTHDGWRQLRNLCVGDVVALPRCYPAPNQGHGVTFAFCLPLSGDPILQRRASSDLLWDEITSISADSEEMVYDLTVEELHNFCVDGFVTHNSGAIEQAADLIALLYREDYYKPDSPERGIVEVNFAKHRNGRTGIVKLLFEKEYSRFLDLYYR
ncbi:MAG: replicative DNA helicase [Xenococcaceae cyanobacterium]